MLSGCLDARASELKVGGGSAEMSTVVEALTWRGNDFRRKRKRFVEGVDLGKKVV